MEWESEWDEMMMVMNRGDDENSSGIEIEEMRMLSEGGDEMTVIWLWDDDGDEFGFDVFYVFLWYLWPILKFIDDVVLI